jgi:hypothetical protein
VDQEAVNQARVSIWNSDNAPACRQRNGALKSIFVQAQLKGIERFSQEKALFASAARIGGITTRTRRTT